MAKLRKVASISDMPLPMAKESGPWRSYKEKLAALAQRVVEAQRPIRILNALKWPADTFEKFRATKFREMPLIAPDHYESIGLGFDPRAKMDEFLAIATDIDHELGADDAVGRVLKVTCQEYISVVRMLEARGQKRFYEVSRQLYGTPKDVFEDDVTRIRDVAFDFYEILTHLTDEVLGPQPVRNIPAEQAVQILNERLNSFFVDDPIRVAIDDGIVADAAAGSDYVKVRQGAVFSERDINILEVHEGWVHVATSMNGQKQPVARWLAKGPPRTAATQEGLAALLEILTLRTYPSRARRLNDRVLAVDKAEDGASFLDVFEWFRTEGYDEETCFWNTQRVFRGGTLDGGAPFTKDIVYIRGLVSNYNFLRSAIQAGRADLIPWLFAGKLALEDVPLLAARALDGVVRPPAYIPPMFRDASGLSIWFAISSFWGRLKNTAMQANYERMFRL